MPTGNSLDEMMAEFEQESDHGLLEQNHYSLTKTAEQLKISRHALRYRMQRLNIPPEPTGWRNRPADSGAKPFPMNLIQPLLSAVAGIRM